MLSPRGLWFLIVVILIFVVGAFLIPNYSVVPALASLALLTWFCVEWGLFQVRVNAVVARLRVSRQMLQGGRESPMLWVGRVFEVRVRVENPSAIALPFAVLEDRRPVATERTRGTNVVFASIPARGQVEIVYSLVAPAPGLLRFEGVNLRVCDRQGFFYHRRFVREAVELPVLPPLTDDEGRQRATKQFNTLPPPGIHRLRRPGSGSELLDLRDYRPGDPPKLIAWKPSARRDKLITKEFESDVPVRCRLFLDTSESVRLGPTGNTLLTRLVEVAAAVAQASAANRDLVGLTTFDETVAHGLLPARTKMHLINVLRRLSEVASLQPGVRGVPSELLTQRAFPLAHELYPELMTKRVNSMPWSRLWLPLLDRKYGWVVLAMILLSPLLLTIRGWASGVANFAAMTVPKSWPFLTKLAWFTLVFLVSIFPPATFGVLFWFTHGVRGWFGERRRKLTQRKQVASVLALQDGSGPAGVERYIHDDEAYAAQVAAFLQRHRLRCPIPLYDERGLYLYRCPGKAVVLRDALIEAVSRARDNELYVVLADLVELGDDLAPVVQAVRVARARHHHILVIVPWPSDVPPPDDHQEAPAGTRTLADKAGKGLPPGTRQDQERKKVRKKPTARNKTGGLAQLLRQTLCRQYQESFKRLRRELGRVGATVMRLNDGDPVRAVLDRLDRVRGMRSRR